MDELAKHMSDAVLAVLVIWMLTAAVRARSRPVLALLGPAATTGAYLLSELLKIVVQEDRPCRGLAGCPAFGDWSFPSNHATIAGAAAVAIWWAHRRWGVLAFALALLAAATRVLLGVHHVHDVVAGLLLGAAVCGLAVVAARRRRTRSTHRRSGCRGPADDTIIAMTTARTLLVWAGTAAPVLWAAVAARPGRFAPWEAIAAVALLGVAAWLLRRRCPVAALVVVMGTWVAAYLPRAQLDSTMGIGVLAVALVVVGFLAGRFADAGERGVVALVAGTASAGGAAALVTRGADAALLAASVMLALTAVPWSFGRYRRRFAELVRAGWERAEQLEDAVERARARERALLAGEMHDLVGHELAQAALRVGALEVDPELDAPRREAAGGARRSITAAAERLADAVSMLRADRAEPAESVAELVARTRLAGLDVTIASSGEAITHPIVERTIHRVVAEALTNAIKHAPGAAVAVTVDGGETIIVKVRNGASPRAAGATAGNGHGLVGLTERVRLVGGAFTAGTRPDGGFAVTARLPTRPAVPVEPPITQVHRARVEQQVRRSARTAALVAVGVGAVVTAGVLSWMVVDAATSVLEPADFAALAVGQPTAAVEPVLPWRTRVDDPDGVPPAPPGAVCRHYSTHANPFDEQHRDLFRLCFRDGALVAKDLLTTPVR